MHIPAYAMHPPYPETTAYLEKFSLKIGENTMVFDLNDSPSAQFFPMSEGSVNHVLDLKAKEYPFRYTYADEDGIVEVIVKMDISVTGTFLTTSTTFPTLTHTFGPFVIIFPRGNTLSEARKEIVHEQIVALMAGITVQQNWMSFKPTPKTVALTA